MGNQHGGLRKKNAKGEVQISFLDQSSDEVPLEFQKRLNEYCVNSGPPSFIKLSFIDYAGTQIVQEFYEVFKQKPLGKGSFGEVWLARTKTKHSNNPLKLDNHHSHSGNNNGREVLRAIKQLKKPEDQTQIGVLKKEVEILRLLRHPAMARCYETFEDRTHIYLVLEFCQGGTLASRLPEASESDAASWLHQILGGVGYLHTQAKIVHRDVKPDNFLFTTKAKDSPLKMIDFGLAERFDKHRLVEAVGTPYYVAPEVLKMMDDGVGKREYTQKCDMWSIGVICYQLFTKSRPFDGAVKQIFQQIMRRSMTSVFSHPNWERVSLEAKDMVSLLLTRDPQIRLSAEQTANHPFFIKKHPRVGGLPCVNSMMAPQKPPPVGAGSDKESMDVFASLEDGGGAVLQKPRLTMIPNSKIAVNFKAGA